MIRRSPAESYLKYLIVHPSLYDLDMIYSICEKEQIDPIGDSYLEGLRGSLRIPVPFHPHDDTHMPSWRFLQTHKLHYFFYQDSCMKQAYRILRKPRIRELVDSMIISHAPMEEISYGLQRYYSMDASKKDLERYKECFYNVDLLDTTELRALVTYRLDSVDEHPNADARKYAKAIKKASYNDPRKTAAELPFSPLSGAVTRLQMGGKAKVDLVELLEQVQRNAALMAYRVSSSSGLHDSTRTVEFVSVVEKAANAIALIQRPDETMTEQLTAIALKTNQTTMPDIHTLSGGNHNTSNEILPTNEEDYDDDEFEQHEDKP